MTRKPSTCRRIVLLFFYLSPDLVFGVLWGAVVIGTFEMFWDLGVDPFWSTLFGPPVPHHMYILEFLLLVMWLLSRRRKYRWLHEFIFS